MSKYLDFDGLSYFWDKTKTYIDDKTDIPIDTTFSVTSSNPIANKAVASLANTLGYETGIWDESKEAWYVHADNNNNILKYFPYQAKGTYETAGCYCTISVALEKVEGWQTVYYTLPKFAVAGASTTAYDSSNVLYDVWIETRDDGVGSTNNVIAFKRRDNNGMVRGADGTANSVLNVTLTYKYK